jgi:hypothetical protein
MGILTEACLREPAVLAFITIRQAVDLLSETRGVKTSDAAAFLITILNDAVHEGRPGLFEQAGAARKVVADLGERYVQVIQSLDALRYGPPADDTNDLEMRYLNAMIKEYDRHSESRIERYRRLIAVLNRVSVRSAEFEKFAALSPKPAPIAAGESAGESVRRVSASTAHENAVLAKLQELSFDPLALSAYPPGRSSPEKQAVLLALRSSDKDTRYASAWKRLTKDGRIKYR